MTQRPQPYRALVNEPTFRALDRLAALAAARGISLGGLALAWLLADSRVSQIVIGPGRPEHLAVVAEALAHPLAAADRADVLAAVTGPCVAADPGQGRQAPGGEVPGGEVPGREVPGGEAPGREAER